MIAVSFVIGAGSASAAGPKGQGRVLVAVPIKSGEAGSNHRGFVDRRLRTLREVAQQPARGDS